MRMALPLHTLQTYALICRYMAPLTPNLRVDKRLDFDANPARRSDVD